MLEHLSALPSDPILGLVTAYNADTNPNKVDLGAGVYKDEQGHTPIMAAVKQAQEFWFAQEDSKVYVAPEGFLGFNDGMIRLLLGDKHSVISAGRVVSVQAPGGCGALRIIAGMLKRCRKDVTIWVSTPTWANHVPLLGSAGIQLMEYPYYNNQEHCIDFDAMLEILNTAQANDLVLLHGCCHNPSGADLTRQQWQVLTDFLSNKGLIPFVDVAYQGLGNGVNNDVWGLRYLAEHCPEVVIAASCSKIFGLYRERVGAAVIIANHEKVAHICRSQLLNIAREIYSMPPSYGAALVDIILNDASLKKVWLDEVTAMCKRISGLRKQFVTRLNDLGAGGCFDYIAQEKGMFSFLGLEPEQVAQMKKEDSVYFVDTSRINVAGLNSRNIDYVVESLLKVIA